MELLKKELGINENKKNRGERGLERKEGRKDVEEVDERRGRGLWREMHVSR